MNDVTKIFESLRPHLLGVAYRMLGAWTDAEDAVQSAWLRAWGKAESDEVRHPRAWWTRVVVRECLDVRAKTDRRRERYTGPWLPEPLGDAVFGPLWGAAQAPAEQQTLRLGMLRLMQSLTPLELAAFLLRDVFDDEYAEIAGTLERDKAAVRQLVRRAREHVAGSPSRFSIERAEHEAMLMAFAQAAASGDIEGVRSLLLEHCVARSDGGGRVSAATRPIAGPLNIARFYTGVVRMMGNGAQELTPRIVDINGLPTLALFRSDGSCDTIMQFVLQDGRVAEVIGVRNPDKLRRVG